MMNWKDIAIGSASTLAVTVLGGVGIYYLTREPTPAPRTEQLVYEVQNIGEFQSPSTGVALQSVRIWNSGDVAAKNVRAAIEYPIHVGVVDRVASLSSGAAGQYSIGPSSSNRVDISIPSLTPSESLSVSLVLDRSIASPPLVSIKSDASIGTKFTQIENEPSIGESTFDLVGTRLMPILVALQVPLAIYFFRRFKSKFSYPGSLNNTAFALIHQGESGTALQLFKRAMYRGECGPNEFANRACCLAISGDLEGARRSLAAARLFDRGRRHTEVIEFNQAIVSLIEKDSTQAEQSLSKALDADRAEVRRWVEYSRVFKDYVKDFPSVQEILDTPPT